MGRVCDCDRVRVVGGGVEPFDPRTDCGPCFTFHTIPGLNAAGGGSGALPIRRGTWHRPAPAPRAARAAAPLPCCGGGYDFAGPAAAKPAAGRVNALPPARLVKVGPERLAARANGYAFNAGLIRYRGRRLMAHRDGWAGSDVHVAELTESYEVVRSTRLHLRHPRAAVGREDPRLYLFGGRPEVLFTGVERVRGKIRTSVLYARLGDDLGVGEVFYPELDGRELWEKNWSPFDHDGERLAVYQTGPRHEIVRLSGNKAERLGGESVGLPWSGGVMRGGAPPVRVGDLYYHWFHGRVGVNRTAHYNVGLSVFEAKPPFRVVALSPAPLLWASAADNAAEANPNYCLVAFPCGATLENGVWRVSMGWNDRGIRVGEWDAAAVDRHLGLA
jgi:predicted GH43/DUF377 family glycosyl hydrolase